MKLTAFILLIGCLTASARGFSQAITLKEKDSPLAKIFREIEKQTGYQFLYFDNDLREAKKVSIAVNNTSMPEVLRQCFRDQPLSYEIVDKTVVVKKKQTEEPKNSLTAEAQITGPQEIMVSGKITDEAGTPLEGVSITVKGRNKGGGATAANGSFSIVAGENDVLEISMIGFEKQEIKVNNRAQLGTIVLKHAVTGLDDVVVVGYGTAKRSHLTGSYTNVSGREIQSVPASNLTNALAGRLSGVTIRQTSGGVPGNSSGMNIRAIGTWNSAAPLYVIDGVVRDSRAFDMLVPTEVESISVLKDAAAASVYGSRAANGVVLVTTKKGKNGKPVVSYSGSVGIGSFTVEPKRESLQTRIKIANIARREFYNPWIFNSEGYKEPLNKTNYTNGVDASDGYISVDVFTDEAVAYYSKMGDGYDWLQDARRVPVTQTHSIDISGGSDKTTYYVGGNYYDEGGMFNALGYNKYSLRSNVETKIAKGLIASLALNTNKSKTKRNPGDNSRASGLYNDLKNTQRLYPAQVDGKWIGRSLNGDGFQQNDPNPVAAANGVNGFMNEFYTNVEFTTALEYKLPFVNGLSTKATFNKYDRNYFYKQVTVPYQTYKLVRDPNDVNGFIMGNEIDETQAPRIQGNKGSISESRYSSNSYQFNFSLNYNNVFGKHEIGAMLNYEQYEYHYEDLGGSISEMQVNTLPYINFGTVDQTKRSLWGGGSEDARLSYIGRVNYGYDSRYLLELSFRRDASVKFAPQHRWGFFPAASAGWRVSEEQFWKNNVGFIDNFKIRGSVGLTGNDAVGAYQWLERASIGGSYYIGNVVPMADISTEANPLITWEKSLNYNYGVDLGFLNSFTLKFDGYFRHTYDILGPQTGNLPDVFGGQLSDANYGVVNSHGFDIELGYTKNINKNLSLWAKGNFGFADNKLVDWAETGIPEHLSRIGKNWDRASGFISDGLITSIHDNGNGTYDITTNTGNVYKNLPNNYDQGWANRNLSDGNHNAYGPGVIFSKDIGNLKDGKLGEPNGILQGDGDRTWIIDRLIPPYTYGLQLGANWKNISLDVMLQGTAGNQNFLHSNNNLESGARGSSYEWYTANAYSYLETPDGIYPRMNNTSSSAASSDFWVRDASFLRLKNVTISYDISKKTLEKIGLSQARIYLTGNNLALLWNPMKYYDPETTGTAGDSNPISSGSSGNYQYLSGITTYPMVRTVTFGVNLSF
ncbi:MAG: TonB-dependent receptor [Sphingobacteriales bacterium]|nr:TonB-dependent receptor [Sphingobacteriales bacterium]OJY84325.1 MAG: hypothetical protein BGP14_18925 [Sphingobacteriales bacterium 44-15]